MNPTDHFSQTYAEARGKFLDAARRADATVESVVHSLKGRDGEELAIDVARLGGDGNNGQFVISSGCHGVEGFAGSGVQVALLRDSGFAERARAAGIALLYIHALNPWGFSWGRRWTEDNIDLNRNFQDFGPNHVPPENRGYECLANALVPQRWPCEEAEQTIWDYVAAHGMNGAETAIASGQYTHPEGLYYGGLAPTWSNRALRDIVRRNRGQGARVVWLDLHTATGPQGVSTMMLAAPADAEALARASAWWGDVARYEHQGSPMVPRVGTLAEGLQHEYADVEYTGALLEFGTEGPVEVLTAVRAAHWLDRQSNPDPALREAIDRRIRDAFYTDTDAWKASTIEQGCDAARLGLAGLSGTA
jgi:hypothetical protein